MSNVRLKHSVYPAGAHPHLVSAIAVAGRVYEEVAGKECVVTSLVDGRHRPDSFHYLGMAADLRTKHLEDAEKDEVLAELRERLGDGWDVLLEFRGQVNEHIHMEWDDGRAHAGGFIRDLQAAFMERLGEREA